VQPASSLIPAVVNKARHGADRLAGDRELKAAVPAAGDWRAANGDGVFFFFHYALSSPEGRVRDAANMERRGAVRERGHTLAC